MPAFSPISSRAISDHSPASGSGPTPPKGNLPYAALPVRVRHKNWRQLVIEADPEWIQESQNPVEYEFTGVNVTKRIFRGYYQKRGAYAP